MHPSWVVTGSGGQLGSALVELLSREGRALLAPTHAELDVADREAVDRYLHGLPAAPDLLVNAAAYTHVDRCEREPDLAARVNSSGPALLAAACRALGTKLVHVSTDYVFSGDERRPRREEDPTGPRSVYGRTKLEGERRVLETSDAFLVVRTSWVFGRGRNFIAAVLDQAARRRRGEAEGPLRVVDDQTGRPTWAVDLASGICGLLEAGARGLYHLANDGIATWWDLARLSLDECGYGDLAIQRIRTEDLDLPAPRPAWSVLDCSKASALGVHMRDWREAVRAHLRSSASPLAGARPGGTQ